MTVVLAHQGFMTQLLGCGHAPVAIYDIVSMLVCGFGIPHTATLHLPCYVRNHDIPPQSSCTRPENIAAYREMDSSMLQSLLPGGSNALEILREELKTIH